jgi:recombinational DNA repair protein RecT
MISLARRSGEIVSIGAYPVHERDEFHFEYGLDPTIRHVPAMTEDPGALTYVYAVAKLKDGGTQFEIMSRAQIDAIMRRAMSNKRQSPWQTDYEEMARKTVIRRLWKYLPVSVEMARAASVMETEDADHQTLDITNYETGEAIQISVPDTVATTAEIKSLRRNEALDKAWFDVAMVRNPAELVKMTAEEVQAAPAAKQESVLIFLRDWLSKNKPEIKS